MTILPAMPLISRGVPAFTNDDFSGSFPASNANNSTYSNYWRCATAPVGGTNSGTLTQAVYLAYDLSSVPASQRGQVVVAWYNDPLTGAYDASLIGANISNLPTSYTIDVNSAAGGSLPSSGWVTKATVTSSNPYHSRQHAIDMTGNNWIRINITAITGGPGNNNAALNMDVHDAHNGNQDNWIFFGDSITQRGLDHSDNAIGNIAPAQINALRSTYFPIWEDAGEAGYTATSVAASINTWLPLFSGKYVALPLGTNDANQNGGFLTNFSANMQTIINAIANAGKIAVIPHIPWARTAGVQTNGPTVNSQIDALIAANPNTTIAGPDLWAYFQANQSLITQTGSPDFDGLHPTDPAGYTAYRQQWVNWATANIYFNTLNTTVRTAYKVRTVLNTKVRTAYKVRTVLKTLTRTLFKIQLSGAGPKPYIFSEVGCLTIARPFSTITSQAVITDINRTLQDTLNVTVVATFPDNSTANATVYWLGKGTYTATYATKGAGTISELWTATDSQGNGSQSEYKNLVPCNF